MFTPPRHLRIIRPVDRKSAEVSQSVDPKSAPAQTVEAVAQVNIPWSNLPPVLAAALVDAQTNARSLGFDAKNPDQGWGYTRAQKVVDEATKLLNRLGVGFMITHARPKLHDGIRVWGVECSVNVFHRSGVGIPTFTAWVPVHERKGIDKSYLASWTGTRKYVLASLLNIAWGEDVDEIEALPDSAPESKPAPPRLVTEEPVRKPDATELERHVADLLKKHVETHGPQLAGRVDRTWPMSCKRAGLLGEPLKRGDDPLKFYLVARYIHNSIDNKQVIMGWGPEQGRISHLEASKLTDAELTDSLGVTLDCAPWGQVKSNTEGGCGNDDVPPEYEENPFIGIQES